MKNLTKIYRQFRDFLVKLQNSDELTKKRWALFLSLILTILIIFIWFKYFFEDNVLKSATSSTLSTESQLINDSVSFWQKMKNGFRSIYNDYKKMIDQFEDLFQKVQSPEETIIK